LLKTDCIAWDDLNSENIEVQSLTKCLRTFGGHCISVFYPKKCPFSEVLLCM